MTMAPHSETSSFSRRTAELRSCAISPTHRWYLRWKRLADFLLAAILLTLLGPVILGAAILVKVTSRGSAFYSQTRLGKDGRQFRIYKLRSMVHNAESRTGAVWSGANDPRVTPVGRVLRDTHIDEFPQLINVLLGQMSLVGPRPERPEIAERLNWELPLYRDRLKVAPGIAGLAQLRLPPDTDLESVRRKLEHDLYYVCRVNPWLDARIVAFTGLLFLRSLLQTVISHVSRPSSESVERSLQPSTSLPATDGSARQMQSHHSAESLVAAHSGLE